MPFDGVKTYSPPRETFHAPRRRRRKRRWIMLLLLLAVLGIGWLAWARVQELGEKIFGSQSFSFGRLFLSQDKLLIGEKEGEVRILLIGIPGGDHDGANLADTMILATVQLPKSDDDQVAVSLFSIPRDLAVNIPGYDIKKINSAYAFGEAGDNNQGPEFAVKTVEGFLQTSIPYYAVVDFQGFKQAVDHVGGLPIVIESSFTDARFPDGKNGYLAPLTFNAGFETMDGTRALQYVRSRHGNNNQGSDFARARRQQQVLKAFKDRILDLGTLSNLKVLDNLLSDFAEHFRTNLEPTEMLRFYKLLKDIEQKDILSTPLDGRTGLICDYIAEEDGQYLLIPCAGFTDFRAIREYWHNQFVSGRLAQEQPKIEIQNSVRGEGLAQYTASLLSTGGQPIITGNFLGDSIYQESIIYDNTGGQKPHTLSYLQEQLQIRTATGPFPFQDFTEGGADFVIIVTSDIRQ